MEEEKMQMKTKRLLSTLMALAMVLSLFAGMPLTASAASPWDSLAELAVDYPSDIDNGGSGDYWTPLLDRQKKRTPANRMRQSGLRVLAYARKPSIIIKF